MWYNDYMFIVVTRYIVVRCLCLLHGIILLSSVAELLDFDVITMWMPIAVSLTDSVFIACWHEL